MVHSGGPRSGLKAVAEAQNKSGGGHSAAKAPDARSEVKVALASSDLRAMLAQRKLEAVQTYSQQLHPTATTILNEGAKLILGGGDGKLTMRTVARLSGVKLASVQYHFGTFEELKFALFMREFGNMIELVWTIFQKAEVYASSPIELLYECAQSFIIGRHDPDDHDNRIYYHLMAFCAHSTAAREKATAFYSFFNTLLAYLISGVNRELSVAQCLERAVLLSSTFEGASVYTVLDVGGSTASAALRSRLGIFALSYATRSADIEPSLG